MDRREIDILHELADRFEIAQKKYPDIYYGEARLAKDSDLESLNLLLKIFVGRKTFVHIYGVPRKVFFFYGDNHDDGLSAFHLMGDDISHLLRALSRSTPKVVMPILRGDDAPFVMAHSLFAMVKALPKNLCKSALKVGVKIALPGFPVTYEGKPKLTKSKVHLLFPGKVLSMAYPNEEKWPSLVRGISHGNFSLMYSLLPFYQTFHEFFGAWACLGEWVTEKQDAPKERGPVTSIVLGNIDDRPLVMGRTKRALTAAEYDILKAILDAKAKGTERLTGPELDKQSGHEEARKYLKKLSDIDGDWKAAIIFPKRKGDGYGVL